MTGFPGVQKFTANGTISPLAITRIWSIDFACSVSAGSLALYNTTTSTTLMLQVASDLQGVGHEVWPNGFLVNNKNGIFVMSGSGATTSYINFSTEL